MPANERDGIRLSVYRGGLQKVGMRREINTPSVSHTTGLAHRN